MTEPFELPPLKRPPVYGVFRWWPENGENWIHPFDIGIVRQLIPGNRVFRREDLDQNWRLVSYGDIRFRIRSAIWYEVAHEGFDVGEFVEIKSRMGKAAPFIGRIKEMIWNQRYQHIEYFLYRSDSIQSRAYLAEDMTLTDSVGKLERPPESEQRTGRPSQGGSLPRD